MLSIIIPTLNEESIIQKTLTNLKNGFTLPHEIIVTDGKSTDKTIEIARSLADKVVVHTEERRQTIAEGRNVGAAAINSASDFVAFMDADCTIKNQDAFFTKILDHFATDPDLVAVNVAIRVLPENETTADKIIMIIFNNYLWLVNNVFHFGVSAGEFQMIRRTVFEKIGGYNPALIAAEDVDLFNRLSKQGKVRYEKGLTIYHTGRRAHKIGWPKLLYLWVMNPLNMYIHGKALSKEWKVIR